MDFPVEQKKRLFFTTFKTYSLFWSFSSLCYLSTSFKVLILKMLHFTEFVCVNNYKKYKFKLSKLFNISSPKPHSFPPLPLPVSFPLLSLYLHSTRPHMYPPPPSYAVLCLTFLLLPHQYRGNNKSPVSQRVCHIVILVSIGLLRQVHPPVRVPHSNLERQTQLQIYWTTFSALIRATGSYISCSQLEPPWKTKLPYYLRFKYICICIISNTHRRLSDDCFCFWLFLIPDIQSLI